MKSFQPFVIDSDENIVSARGYWDEIIAIEERLTGLVIELHDVDIHLNKIEKFIDKFSLNLVHVHANNFAPIRAYDHLPIVLELTNITKVIVTTDPIDITLSIKGKITPLVAKFI